MSWLEGIDSRAAIHPAAKLGEKVTVGPFSVIGPEVVIGDGTFIGPHVTIDGRVSVGRDNKIYPYASIGLAPQDLKYGGEPTAVEIGDGNVFREGCQVNRGTAGGGGVTRIGDGGLFMALCHVAHDCVIGNGVIFGNAATLAGHVEVGADANVGAYSGVHQFCRVGPYAFIGGYSVVTRDALPYCLTVGNRAHCYGINRIGLQRRGFAKESVSALERATRAIFRPGRKREESLTAVSTEFAEIPEVRALVDFIRTSERGVIPMRLGQGRPGP